MAVWEFAGGFIQRENETPPPDHTGDPLTIEAFAQYRFRGYFTIANGDEAINAGNLRIQRRIDGGSWTDWPGAYAKNIQPGHGIVIPEFVHFDLIFSDAWIDSLVEVRLEVEWDGGPWYSALDVDVSVVGFAPASEKAGTVTAPARSSVVRAVTVAGDVVALGSAGTVRGSGQSATVVGHQRSAENRGKTVSADSLAKATSGRVIGGEHEGDVEGAVLAGRVGGSDSSGDVTAPSRSSVVVQP